MAWKYMPIIIGMAVALGACAPKNPPEVLQSASIPFAQEYTVAQPKPAVKKAATKKRIKRRTYKRRTVAAKKVKVPANVASTSLRTPAIPVPVTPVEPAPVPPLTTDQKERYRLDPFQETPQVEPPRLQ